MNYSVYIFGELSAGYTQYPEDSSSDVLKGLYRQCKAPTQIVVRRDGSMMYYCYIRKLDGSKYIGISISINGFYISAISGMFSLYEKTIEKMAKQGVFVHFAPNGTLTTSLKALKFETEEAEALIANIRQNFENLAAVPKPLPRTDFSIAKDSVKDFSVSDDKADIIKSSYTYGFTYIYKDKDFDTVRMNSYRSVLQRITDDNNSLKEANQKLQDEVAEVKRQKKQFKNVVILLLLVIGCGVGIYMLYNNLSITQNDLSSTKEQLDHANNEIAQKQAYLEQAHSEIAEKDDEIAAQADSIASWTERCENLQTRYDEQTAEFDDYKGTIAGMQPFLFKSSKFNFSSGYLSVYYYGLVDGSCDISVRVIYPDGSTKIFKRSFYVSKGSDSVSIYISNLFDTSKYYIFELLYDGKVIGGGRH